MDAGSTFSTKYLNERIPLLEEVFMIFKDRALINVELKNYHNPSDALPEKVVEIVNRIDVLDQLLFSSSFPSNSKTRPVRDKPWIVLEGLKFLIKRWILLFVEFSF